MKGFGVVLWVIVLIVYTISQFVAAWMGGDYYIGPFLTGGLIVLALVTRFTLPLTIFAFFGAWTVWGWPWYAALLFAAPGVILMGLAMAADGFAGTFRRFGRARR